jgi:hypothetical protein
MSDDLVKRVDNLLAMFEETVDALARQVDQPEAHQLMVACARANLAELKIQRARRRIRQSLVDAAEQRRPRDGQS